MVEVVVVAIVFPMATPSFPGWVGGVYLHSKPSYNDGFFYGGRGRGELATSVAS